MEIIDWKSLPPEYYLIGGLCLLLVVFFVAWISARKKLKSLRRKEIADQIELEESGKHERWFRVFTQTIPQVFWIRNARETVYVSPHFEQLTGHPESLFNHFPHGLLKICHPEDQQRVQEDHQKFLDTMRGSLDITFRIRKSGQHYIWIRERIFIYRHTSGERFYVGLLEDITEKQKFLEEISDQKLLLNNILETTDEGIFCLDTNLKCIFWNNEMEEISGQKKETVIAANNLFEVFPHLRKNGVETVIRETLKGQILPPATYPFHLPNNRKGQTFEKYLPLTNSKGERIGVLGIVRDITEEMARETILEKTQERYGLTLKALNDGIWDWDLRDDSVIFSDHWFEMLGYSPDELSASLKTLLALLQTDQDRKVIDAGAKSLKMGQPIQLEVQMRHKTGETRWMMIRGNCTEYNQDGVATRAMGTQTDITQRKEYELALVEAKNKAEESDHLKSAFLANMSHEIRTPLNAIIGFTDLLSSGDELDQAELDGFRTQIRKNSDHLLHLIDDIVLLSLLEAGQLEKSKESFDLTNELKTTAQTLYKQFGKPKADQVKLAIQIPPEAKGLELTTDRNLLRKCISNLIENGLAFTASGQVSVGYRTPENQHVQIFIRDTGPGIKEADQERIFHQFTQLEHGLNRSHSGTGLGLSLVKKIIELLDGDISVESEPGKGSCFCLNLPYQTPSEKP